jgi:RNA polymerase sigma-54 factor
MAGKQILTQEQKLQQRLSPLQLQLVPLLQMNGTEIEEKVRREMDDNPALEESETPPTEQVDKDEEGETFTETAEDVQKADYGDDDDIPYYRTSANNSSADDEIPNAVVIAENSLVDYLMEQIHERDLTDDQNMIAEYIIGNLDNNGYLHRSLSAITDDIVFQTGHDVPEEEVDTVLQAVRDLDPAGVGASDLRDCLLLQLERSEGTTTNMLAYKVIDEHFEEFSKKHYDKITSALGIDDEQLKKVFDAIRSLNPKPGSAVTGVADDSHSQQIIPDFNVDIDGRSLNLTLLNNIPELQIAESYSMLYDKFTAKKPAGRKEEEAATDIKDKYERASNFIKVLHQRQETLFKTMRAITFRQHEFFITGDDTKLHPMILKDIADDTGYDVSVISRATANKYVTTQWGVYPLKYFFNEGIQHESGDEVSSREIQSILKKVIEAENKHKPLSDEQLCALLKDKGYEIARRTVAKYREKLGIPVARLRKEI